MSGATIVADAFGEGACLYTVVLGLPSAGADVTAAQLRKAYYKRALVYHPDKQSGKTDDEAGEAKSKFQAVSVAYSVLSNPETRAEYDETGELVEDEEGDEDKSGMEAWKDYFSGIFGNVTTDDIDKFEAEYKCSKEEEADVLKYYKAFKGNLDKMLECVMLSKDVDKKRWVEDFIEPAIKRGDVESYDETLKRTMGSNDTSSDEDDDEMDDEEADSEETETEDDSEDEKKASPKNKKSSRSRKKAPPKKKKEQTKHKKKASGRKKAAAGGPDADLIAAIRGNAVARSGRSFDAMMAGLEDRYSGEGGGKKKSKNGKGSSPPDDIPDDEFAKIQARMEAKRKSKSKK